MSEKTTVMPKGVRLFGYSHDDLAAMPFEDLAQLADQVSDELEKSYTDTQRALASLRATAQASLDDRHCPECGHQRGLHGDAGCDADWDYTPPDRCACAVEEEAAR